MTKHYSFDELQTQENTLQFETFNNNTAWDLGCLLKQEADTLDTNLAFEIYAYGHTLFSYAMSGTFADHQNWLYRKRQTVLRFAHSSLLIAEYNRQKSRTLEEMSHIDATEYAFQGGSFPITIRNNGLVGAVTASGLTQEEDHRIVVETIAKYNNIKS